MVVHRQSYGSSTNQKHQTKTEQTNQTNHMEGSDLLLINMDEKAAIRSTSTGSLDVKSLSLLDLSLQQPNDPFATPKNDDLGKLNSPVLSPSFGTPVQGTMLISPTKTTSPLAGGLKKLSLQPSFSKVSPVTSPKPGRLNPIPPPILPIHYNLPTRKWIDSSVFSEIPMQDQLLEAIAKTFSHQPANQRPKRLPMTLAIACESQEPYAVLISTSK